MTKKFWQLDVAESGSENNIWTSPVFYVDCEEEAEFHAMCHLQMDWGDSYVPDSFIETFGDSESEREAEFPGADSWKAGGYWWDWELMRSISIGMLEVPPLEALAQLGKIESTLTPEQIDLVMDDKAQAELVVSA